MSFVAPLAAAAAELFAPAAVASIAAASSAYAIAWFGSRARPPPAVREMKRRADKSKKGRKKARKSKGPRPHCSSVDDGVCDLCAEEGRVVRLSRCGCSVCADCTTGQIRLEVAQGRAAAPRCPTACGGTLSVSDAAAAFFSGSGGGPPAFERYEGIVARAVGAAVADAVHCPAPNCQATYFLPRSEFPSAEPRAPARSAATVVLSYVRVLWPGNWRAKVREAAAREARAKHYTTDENGCDARCAECAECGTQWCLLCSSGWRRDIEGGKGSIPHDGRSCEQFSRSDGLTDTVAEVRRIAKPCPKCRAPIERISGCPHMRCSRCACEWCWNCGRGYEGPGLHRQCPARS